MSDTITLSVPATQRDLANEILNDLGPLAEIQHEQAKGGAISFTGGLPDPKLIIQLFTLGAGALTAGAGAMGALSDNIPKVLDLIKRIKNDRRAANLKVTGPGGEVRSLENVDESWLRSGAAA